MATRHSSFVLIFGNDTDSVMSFTKGLDLGVICQGIWVNPIGNPAVATVLQVPTKLIKNFLSDIKRAEVPYRVFNDYSKADGTISEMMLS